jgi:hypothetical protein
MGKLPVCGLCNSKNVYVNNGFLVKCKDCGHSYKLPKERVPEEIKGGLGLSPPSFGDKVLALTKPFVDMDANEEKIVKQVLEGNTADLDPKLQQNIEELLGFKLATPKKDQDCKEKEEKNGTK